MIIPKLTGKIAFGGDYNPEQWPESVWIEDMRLMKEAGVNFVSVGIFSWARLQPGPDEWTFEWLDRILDLLAENEIFVCLATATASPPAWLVKAHPEMLPKTREGKTLCQGSRQHFSPSSSAYREAASKLVEKIAARYLKHPALAAWHINNEYACHLPECHNEESTKRFRLWLKSKYKSLDALNHAWGTTFWSQLYSDWEEIQTPREAPYFSNPTQQLDFRRFTSDAFLELYLLEKRILKSHTPDLPVTTNFMGFFQPLDYHRWSKELDFTAWDSYPDPIDEKAGRQMHAAGNDLTRSLKPGKAFVLMEQATSAVNWRDMNMPKRPGLNRLWSMQSVARGGDGIMYFQWRASTAGTEKFHSAVVQHVGAERSRVFKETASLGADLEKLSPVAGSQLQAKVAIVFDWHSWWSLEVDSRPSRIDYQSCCNRIHDWFYRKNIPVDFIAPDSDLSGYSLVVAPSLYILSKETAVSIEDYVSKGGTFLASYFSGIVDENDHVQLGGYPAFLKKLLGLWVEEWHPYPEGVGNKAKPESKDATFDCTDWADIIHLDEANALASFQEGFFAGKPAFTKNSYGDGNAFYLASKFCDKGLEYVLDEVCCKAAGVEPLLDVPEGIEVSLRQTDTKRFLFLLNHTDEEMIVELADYCGTDLLAGYFVEKSITLPSLDVSVIQLRQ